MSYYSFFRQSHNFIAWMHRNVITRAESIIVKEKFLELKLSLNPFVANEFVHRYHLGESTLILRGIRSDFKLLFPLSMKIV